MKHKPLKRAPRDTATHVEVMGLNGPTGKMVPRLHSFEEGLAKLLGSHVTVRPATRAAMKKK